MLLTVSGTKEWEKYEQSLQDQALTYIFRHIPDIADALTTSFPLDELESILDRATGNSVIATMAVLTVPLLRAYSRPMDGKSVCFLTLEGAKRARYKLKKRWMAPLTVVNKIISHPLLSVLLGALIIGFLAIIIYSRWKYNIFDPSTSRSLFRDPASTSSGSRSP